VVVAVIVVLAVVCARLLGLVADIEAWVRVDRLVPQAALSTGATSHEVTVERITGAVLGLAVLLTDAVPGLLLALLSWGVWRGNRLARLGTCAVAALLAVCCGVATVSFANRPSTTDSAFEHELTRLSNQTEPAWVTASVVPDQVVTIVGSLLAAVLLLTPVANRFFHNSHQRR
jgi:hypothetical protein